MKKKKKSQIPRPQKLLIITFVRDNLKAIFLCFLATQLTMHPQQLYQIQDQMAPIIKR